MLGPLVWSAATHPHLLQRFGQHVTTLLLVDKDDDGRLEAVRQHLQQLLPAPHGIQNQSVSHSDRNKQDV